MHFDGIRNVHLEQVAAELYSDQMPYHNFNHVLRTLAAGEVLVERCLREGVPISGEVVYCALLFHDAGYHEDHISKGFTSKEEYSAHLAVQCLRAKAIPEDTIKRVVAAILSTERDAQFTSNEEKAVRAMRKKQFELRISLVSRAITRPFGLMWKSCDKNPKC